MKYYFVSDSNGKRHIVIAINEHDAKKVLENANLKIDDFYELTSDTFNQPGFLISDK